MYVFIINSHKDVLSVSLIAELVSTAPASQRPGFESPFRPEFLGFQAFLENCDDQIHSFNYFVTIYAIGKVLIRRGLKINSFFFLSFRH